MVDIIDCWVDFDEVYDEYGIILLELFKQGDYDVLFLVVFYWEYVELILKEFWVYLKDNGVLFDLKGVLLLGEVDLCL